MQLIGGKKFYLQNEREFLTFGWVNSHFLRNFATEISSLKK